MAALQSLSISPPSGGNKKKRDFSVSQYLSFTPPALPVRCTAPTTSAMEQIRDKRRFSIDYGEGGLSPFELWKLTREITSHRQENKEAHLQSGLSLETPFPDHSAQIGTWTPCQNDRSSFVTQAFTELSNKKRKSSPSLSGTQAPVFGEDFNLRGPSTSTSEGKTSMTSIPCFLTSPISNSTCDCLGNSYCTSSSSSSIDSCSGSTRTASSFSVTSPPPSPCPSFCDPFPVPVPSPKRPKWTEWNEEDEEDEESGSFGEDDSEEEGVAEALEVRAARANHLMGFANFTRGDMRKQPSDGANGSTLPSLKEKLKSLVNNYMTFLMESGKP